MGQEASRHLPEPEPKPTPVTRGKSTAQVFDLAGVNEASYAVYNSNPSARAEGSKRDESLSDDSSTSTSSDTYRANPAVIAEARRQYELGQGLFWSLAVLQLSENFLHPIDLTEAEFVNLVTVDDADAWIAERRSRLVHRMIMRRADALRTLKLAGVPYRHLRSIEMFELMDDAERNAFLVEYHEARKNKKMEELRDAIMQGIVPASLAADIAARNRSRLMDSTADDATDVEEEALERERRQKRNTLLQPSSEDHARRIERRRSIFATLGKTFSMNARPERDVVNLPASGNSVEQGDGATASGAGAGDGVGVGTSTGGGADGADGANGTADGTANSATIPASERSRRRARALGGSMRSLRRLFERRSMIFKRTVIRDSALVD